MGHLTVKNGNMAFEYGPLALAMRYGGLCLLNEIDLLDPSTAAGLNGILDGQPLCIPENGGELIAPHPMFRFAATANSNGGAAQPRGGQGRSNNPRSGGAANAGANGEKRGGARNGAGSGGRDGQPRRDGANRNRRPAREESSRQEPAVRNPREGQPQPKIIHKESKVDRFPTAEQLEQLPSRPRGEKPALLTRNR